MQSPCLVKSDWVDSVVGRRDPVPAAGGGGGGGRAWQEVQGAELGCLLRRLMVQASAEYKKDGLTAPSFLYLPLSGISLFPGRPVLGARPVCRSEPGD